MYCGPVNAHERERNRHKPHSPVEPHVTEAISQCVVIFVLWIIPVHPPGALPGIRKKRKSSHGHMTTQAAFDGAIYLVNSGGSAYHPPETSVIALYGPFPLPATLALVSSICSRVAFEAPPPPHRVIVDMHCRHQGSTSNHHEWIKSST